MALVKYRLPRVDAGIALRHYYIGDTFADLPTTGLEVGELALALDTKYRYIATSATTWEEIGSMKHVQAYATAETSISAATFADISGCSIALTPGSWLITATIVMRAANLAFLGHVAITDAANTVITESSQGMAASGTASVNQYASITLTAYVTIAANTTYKLRAARGNTTLTNTFSVVDGSGVGTTNNVSSNTDKGTVIRAIRTGA